LVVDSGAAGTGIAARKGLLQGHFLEQGDRQYLLIKGAGLEYL
jgi:hypothetical protein